MDKLNLNQQITVAITFAQMLYLRNLVIQDIETSGESPLTTAILDVLLP